MPALGQVVAFACWLLPSLMSSSVDCFGPPARCVPTDDSCRARCLDSSGKVRFETSQDGSACGSAGACQSGRCLEPQSAAPADEPPETFQLRAVGARGFERPLTFGVQAADGAMPKKSAGQWLCKPQAIPASCLLFRLPAKGKLRLLVGANDKTRAVLASADAEVGALLQAADQRLELKPQSSKLDPDGLFHLYVSAVKK